jgi:hypothetical protein
MWLCTWHPCWPARSPKPCRRAGEQDGTKRGVITGWTSVVSKPLQHHAIEECQLASPCAWELCVMYWQIDWHKPGDLPLLIALQLKGANPTVKCAFGKRGLSPDVVQESLCVCQVLLRGVDVVVLGVPVHAHLAHIRPQPCLHSTHVKKYHKRKFLPFARARAAFCLYTQQGVCQFLIFQSGLSLA